MLILKIFYNPLKYDQELAKPVGPGGGFATSIVRIMTKLIPNLDKEIIKEICKDLENLDLIINIVSGFETIITDQGIDHLHNKITRKGIGFYNYISD